MFCERCGKPMNREDRCCLSCGYINPYNEKNSNNNIINQYNKNNMINQEIETLTIDDNINYSNNTNYDVDLSFKNNKPMYIVNMIIALLPVIAITLLTSIFDNSYIFNGFIFIAIALIYSIFSNFYSLCFQIMLRKANEPWWSVFLPIYNIYIVFKLAKGNAKSLVVFIILTIIIYAIFFVQSLFSSTIAQALTLISIVLLLVMFIILLSLQIDIAKRFNQNWLLFLLFPGIMIPIIALNKNIKYSPKL